MNSIVNVNTILDNDNYLESLLLVALERGIISNTQYEDIIFKICFLLSERIKRYTGELTSSVPLKLASNINNSNIWILGIYLRKFNIKDSISLLLSEDINRLYNLSKMSLDEFFSKTKLFYKVVFLNNMLDINNYFYKATMREGIEAFFRLYDTSYDALNIHISADYGPCLERPKLRGVEFIRRYLEYINYENIFCRKFNSDRISNLLGRIYSDYRDLPINIFENVFIMAIILEYLDKDIFELEIFEFDVAILYNDFSCSRDYYINKLKKSYMNLKVRFKFDLEIIRYLDKCFDSTINVIIRCSENNNLEMLLGLDTCRRISYVSSSRMDDDKYFELLRLVENGNDRVTIVRNKVKSFYDIIRVFEDINFTSNELFQIFSGFQIIELMVLKKWYNYNYDRFGILDELNRFIYTKDLKIQDIINKNYDFIFINDEE